MEKKNTNMPNILVVDDEERFRITLGKLLKTKGYAVKMAASGEEAVNIVQQDNTIDVVLLDVRMPGINGVDTLSILKKIDPFLEIIILTGHASVDAAVEIMRRGGFEYLLKPCDFEDLLSKIDAAFEKSMLKRQSKTSSLS